MNCRNCEEYRRELFDVNSNGITKAANAEKSMIWPIKYGSVIV